MATLVERSFQSDDQLKVLKQKKRQFAERFEVSPSLAELFYIEVRIKILKKIEDQETEIFKLLGLDK